MEPFTDGRHDRAPAEEWVFTCWSHDATCGVISGHRIVGRRNWYWAALARAGQPLLHVTDFDVPVRSDPFIVKGEALWAEHHCDDPMRQWSIGNETYAASLDDPEEALDRAYGDPTPIAFDLEWYATGDPVGLPASQLPDGSFGYEQSGEVLGEIEVLGIDPVRFRAVPARRWHRWLDPWDAALVGTTELPPLDLPVAAAHTAVRAPFRFPDGTVTDWVLTSDGWRRRRDRQANP
jgi:hypothetical protein